MSRKRKLKGNTLAEYHKKLEEFERIRNNIPNMEKELEDLQKQLSVENERIREQQRASSKVRVLKQQLKELTRQRTTKEWYKLFTSSPDDPDIAADCPNLDLIQLYWDIKKESENSESLRDSYHKSGDLVTEINALEKKIMRIKSRTDETDFILENINDIKKIHETREMNRTGLGSILNDSQTYELPKEERVVYLSKSVESKLGPDGEIKVEFVTKTGRPIFDTQDSFHFSVSPKQLLVLYCFKMRDICGVDLVADRIIQEKSRMFLTQHHLLLPTDCKTIDQVLVHYGIDATKTLTVWVDTEQFSDVDSEYASTTIMFNKRKQRLKKHVDDKHGCTKCNAFYILDKRTGDMLCPKCGTVARHQTGIAEGLDGVPFSHQMTLVTSSSDYQPIMHLNDILKQDQALESLIVPDHILDAVDQERIKFRCSVQDMDYWKVKHWLKKLSRGDREKIHRYTKYYNNIPQIIMRLGGPEPVKYSLEDERTIRKLFLKLIEPFRIFCPKVGKFKRRNLLGYNYLLRLIFLIISDQAKTEEEQSFWYTQAQKRPIVQCPKLLSFYNKISEKMTLLAHLPYFKISH